jgi:hypothetical protein
MTTKEAVQRYKLIQKIEEDTRQDLSGIKRKITDQLTAAQVEELAAAIYAEVGALGFDKTQFQPVKK